MDNNIANELTNARAERLRNTPDNDITILVTGAVEMIMPRAINGLAGIDAENDRVTKALWTQAIDAAEMDGSLVLPGYLESYPADAEPCSFEVARDVIAGRVARAILVVNGFVISFGPTHGPDVVNVDSHRQQFASLREED